MKTLRQWLETLPKSVKDRALSQIDPNYNEGPKKLKKLSDAILTFNAWGKTKEGISFWDTQYLKALKKETKN